MLTDQAKSAIRERMRGCTEKEAEVRRLIAIEIVDEHLIPECRELWLDKVKEDAEEATEE